MKNHSKLLFGAVGLSVVLSIASIAPAYAVDNVDDVSAADVESALAGVTPALLEEAVDASATSTVAAVVNDSGTGVSIPRDPSEGVDLTVGTASISIGLPELDGASSAVTLESGAITYPADNGVANTVVPLIDGVQMLTTIASADAPTSFSYPVQLPQGGSVALTGDGSAVIADAAGNPLVTTTAPWAVDANGAPVPTHYEIDGTSLVQVVDHTSKDFAYPIVADPSYTYWWGGKTWMPANQVNVSLVAAALSAFITPPIAAIVGAGLGLCNNAGKGIWVYWTWAGHVWCTGP